MRESRESRGRSVSLNLSGVPDTALAHHVTFKQSASGTGPTFCSAEIRTAEGQTVELTTRSTSAPGLVAIDAVFVSDQVNRSLDCSEPFGPCASSAALVLRKYSAPFDSAS